MDKVNIYFSKIKTQARIPLKRAEDAGYDIYACLEEDFIKVDPHQTVMLSTGLASACPSEYYFQIAERGSTGTKGIGQRCGVIDSGYRGEWFIPITNHNTVPLYFVKPEKIEELRDSLEDSAIIYPSNKAICQVLVLPVPKTEVFELSFEQLCEMKSNRSDGKLGSSGK